MIVAVIFAIPGMLAFIRQAKKARADLDWINTEAEKNTIDTGAGLVETALALHDKLSAEVKVLEVEVADLARIVGKQKAELELMRFQVSALGRMATQLIHQIMSRGGQPEITFEDVERILSSNGADAPGEVNDTDP